MDWLSVVGTVVLAVLSSSVVAAVVANRASYKSIAVEAITKERITWLDELRSIAEDLATASAEVAFADTVDAQPTAKVDRISARLELQLNPDGEQEKEVIRSANTMVTLARARQDGFAEAERKFMFATRRLLKIEWDKAKFEAGVTKKCKKENHK